jgi:hypothetical protein
MSAYRATVEMMLIGKSGKSLRETCTSSTPQIPHTNFGAKSYFRFDKVAFVTARPNAPAPVKLVSFYHRWNCMYCSTESSPNGLQIPTLPGQSTQSRHSPQTGWSRFYSRNRLIAFFSPFLLNQIWDPSILSSAFREVFFPGVKAAELWRWNLPQNIVNVKNMRCHTSVPPYVFMKRWLIKHRDTSSTFYHRNSSNTHRVM